MPEVLKYSISSTVQIQKLGFEQFCEPALLEAKPSEIKRMVGRSQQPGIQAPCFLSLALWCPAAPWPWPSNPSPDDCSEGAVGKAGLKGHLVATKSLLSQPRDTSLPVCIINQFGACSLRCCCWECSFTAPQEKTSTIAFWFRKHLQRFF